MHISLVNMYSILFVDMTDQAVNLCTNQNIEVHLRCFGERHLIDNFEIFSKSFWMFCHTFCIYLGR